MTDFFGTGKPWVIAGPCSAESEEQLVSTAAGLCSEGVRFFRAGLWKPRTRPGCFEGVGERGIPWLVRVQKEFGMKVCTEVAGAGHVELCLAAGLDMLWIGARTTTNPFLMQELADALQGTSVPVLVKNPINADLQLWSGAVERLQARGVRNIGLIHRGFSSFESKRYRNSPQWQIAAEMRRLHPDMPFFCDPSHMGGNSDFIRELSQRAMDLGFDGLMIESHIDPSSALSDSQQQIQPRDLGNILRGLAVRTDGSADDSFSREVTCLRATIDSLDEDILDIISRRMEVCRRIGLLKKEKNVAIIQPERWGDVLQTALGGGRRCGLSQEFINQLFNIIHAASIAEQNKILENDSKNQS